VRVDARGTPRSSAIPARFRETHIPGAVFFDIDGIADRSLAAHMLPSAARFASQVGELGISNADLVVVYDCAE
jgi:thiosulfate/3-mercaptopyruvate sulfurtransferase